MWGWHGRNNRELLDQGGWSLFIQWQNKQEGRQALLLKDRVCSRPKGRVCIQLDTPPRAGIHKVTPAALFGSSLQLVPHRSGYLAAQVQALKEHMHTQRHAHTLTCFAGLNMSSFSTPDKLTHPCQHQPSWLENSKLAHCSVKQTPAFEVSYFFKLNTEE